MGYGYLDTIEIGSILGYTTQGASGYTRVTGKRR